MTASLLCGCGVKPQKLDSGSAPSAVTSTVESSRAEAVFESKPEEDTRFDTIKELFEESDMGKAIAEAFSSNEKLVVTADATDDTAVFTFQYAPDLGIKADDVAETMEEMADSMKDQMQDLAVQLKNNVKLDNPKVKAVFLDSFENEILTFICEAGDAETVSSNVESDGIPEG